MVYGWREKLLGKIDVRECCGSRSCKPNSPVAFEPRGEFAERSVLVCCFCAKSNDC